MAPAAILLSHSSFGAEFLGTGRDWVCTHMDLWSYPALPSWVDLNLSVDPVLNTQGGKSSGFDANHAGVLPRAVFRGEKGQRRSLTPPWSDVWGWREVAQDQWERSGLQTLPGSHLNRGLEVRVWLGRGARPLALGLPPCGNCLLCCFGLSGAEDGLACCGSMSAESLPAAMHKLPSLRPACCYAIKSCCQREA